MGGGCDPSLDPVSPVPTVPTDTGPAATDEATCAVATCAPLDCPSAAADVLRHRGSTWAQAFGELNDLASADLDGDGAAELVVAGDPAIRVLGNDGAGHFVERAPWTPEPPLPRALGVATADLDGDGAVDVVVGVGTDDLRVLFGDGVGGLASHRAYAVPDATTSPISRVLVADLDGDGDSDVVVAPHLRVLHGDGAGGLAHHQTVAGRVRHVVLEDLNGDARSDLVVVGGDPNAFVWLPADGAGGFGAAVEVPSGTNVHGLAVGDLDGDGDADVVTANWDSSDLSVHLNDGSGAFPARTDHPLAGPSAWVALADADSDGDLDVTVASIRGPAVLPNDGAGDFGAPIGLDAGSGVARWLDLDGVAGPDLVLTRSGTSRDRSVDYISVVLEAGPGPATPPLLRGSLDSSAGSLAVGDVDGDGAADFVVGSRGLVTVFTRSGSELVAGLSLALPYTSREDDDSDHVPSLAVGDLDGDGDLDLVATLEQTHVFTQTGPATFTEGPGAVGGPRLMIADMDSDGHADIVGGYDAPRVGYGDGAGRFTTRETPTGGVRHEPLALADLDCDGDEDLLTAYWDASGADFIGLVVNDGAGLDAAPVELVGLPDEVEEVAPLDLDCDGDWDLAAVPEDRPAILLLRNDGPDGFAWVGEVALPSVGRAVGVGDLDGDGVADLAVSTEWHGVVVLPGDGTGSLGAPISLMAGLNGTGLVVADLDGSCALDVAVANLDGSELTVLLSSLP